MGCFRVTFWQAGQRQPSAESADHRFDVNRHFHTDFSVIRRQRTVCLGGRRSSPFLDAVQVEDVEAALAAPHGGHQPDDVAANHALVFFLRQLLDQTPCRRGPTPTHVECRLVSLPSLMSVSQLW